MNKEVKLYSHADGVATWHNYIWLAKVVIENFVADIAEKVQT